MRDSVPVQARCSTIDIPLLVQKYNGFNLLVGDLSGPSAVQVSNRVDNSIQQLGLGLHGISNGKLGAASWPKVGH